MDDRDEPLIEELTLGPEGRSRGPPEAHYSRDLTEADLSALDLPRGVAPRSLVRIHSSHHALAKCLAAGMRPAQAALVTGYSNNRISSLQRDPLFVQLVAEYRLEEESVMADLAVRMRGLSHDAIELLHDKLLERPEDFSPAMLLDIVKATADRTGYGTNSNVNLNVTLPTIDRPPREDYDKWKERKLREFESTTLLEPPTRTTN